MKVWNYLTDHTYPFSILCLSCFFFMLYISAKWRKIQFKMISIVTQMPEWSKPLPWLYCFSFCPFFPFTNPHLHNCAWWVNEHQPPPTTTTATTTKCWKMVWSVVTWKWMIALFVFNAPSSAFFIIWIKWERPFQARHYYHCACDTTPYIYIAHIFVVLLFYFQFLAAHAYVPGLRLIVGVGWAVHENIFGWCGCLSSTLRGLIT